ncbi:Hypothetical protein PACV_319 [Pacmanvirus A23]|uniref:Hypothetical protein n=1 Tax=Pacmanvirus A23 TaxID=1932881 RepID=UPI000A095A6C|nr:Hypothetical protein B9W72_gp315 [Pacmanvirus A23]SIP86032.1 Hypothetical protein PACV_319 [Pacmanvirus A23]
MSCDPSTCKYYHAWTQHIEKNDCPDSCYCYAFSLDDDEVIAHMESEHGGTSAKPVVKQAPRPTPKSVATPTPRPVAKQAPKPAAKPAMKPAETKQWRKPEAPKKQVSDHKPRQKPKQFSSSKPPAPIPMDAEVVPFLDYKNGCKWVVHQVLRTVTSDGQVRYLIGICGRKKAEGVNFCRECNNLRLAKIEQRTAAETPVYEEPEESDSEHTETEEGYESS